MSFVFSNFLPFEDPMVVDGLTYPTPEHYYQAMKTDDLEWRRKIANAGTASKAKALGKRAPIRENWDKVKLQFMEQALRHKFSKGTDWLEKLVATSGLLVEWNDWHDKYWGICHCSKCGAKGQNHLGKLLMKIRDEAKGET